MRSARLLIALLVAATVLVDAVVFVMFRQGLLRELELSILPGTILVLALSFSQVSLLAMWVGLGHRGSPWPWTGLIAGIVLWSLFIATVVHGSQNTATRCTVHLSILAILIAAVLSLVRLKRVVLVRPLSGDTRETSASDQRRFQFSLARLFGWMTGLAICLGLLQYTINPKFLALAPVYLWISAAWLGSANTAIALSALWMALGTRRFAIRLFTLPLAILLAITMTLLGTTSAEWGYRTFFLLFLAIHTLQALLLVGSLWVFRVAGYRLGIAGRSDKR